MDQDRTQPNFGTADALEGAPEPGDVVPACLDDAVFGVRTDPAEHAT